MAAPSVQVNKLTAAIAQAAQTDLGILAIIAPSVAGPVNTPSLYFNTGLVQTTFSEGPLVEDATYFINEAGNPCLLIRPTTSTPGFYTNPAQPNVTVASVTNGPPAALTVTAGHNLSTGDVVLISGATGDTAINGTWLVTVTSPTVFTIPVTGSGSYAPNSATVAFGGLNYIGTGNVGSSTPGSFGIQLGSAAGIADDYQCLVTVVTGGTLGTTGIVLQASLDGGLLYGSQVSLGTNLTFTPNVPITGVSSGIVFDFTSGDTLVAGDTFFVISTGPRMTTADLTSALAVLRSTKLAWDLVLVHGETSAAFVAACDTWSNAFNPYGIFPFLLLSTRHKYLPVPAAETDAAFQTAMSTLLSEAASINVCVGTDAAWMVSAVSGLTKPQFTNVYIATRLEASEIGVDPAYVALGPLGNANLDNPSGALAWHDEWAEPGLDSSTIRLSTLRSWPDEIGTFITNAYVLSTPGSPYVFAQQARVMNAACEAVFAALTPLVSAGYPTNLKTGLIQEATAADWEARGQAVLNAAVSGQVSGAVFTVSRNDINLGNGPATITCSVSVASLKYVKKFVVGAQFVNTIV